MARLPLSSLTILLLAITTWTASAAAGSQSLTPRDGWEVWPSPHSYDTLIERLDSAAQANKIGVVTRASAALGAKRALNKTIPGNMVVGLYHPRFAVRMLDASLAAGIEAPLRMYLIENADGTATLSYKRPSHVFTPYFDEGGAALREMAAELDELFAAIARQASGN